MLSVGSVGAELAVDGVAGGVDLVVVLAAGRLLGRSGCGVQRLVADRLGLVGVESFTGLLRLVIKSDVCLLPSGGRTSDDGGLV